jgi:hypothetical protein
MKMVKILALSALLSVGAAADDTLALNMSQMEKWFEQCSKRVPLQCACFDKRGGK